MTGAIAGETGVSMFVIWLNDTNPKRYYWSQPAQNWTTATAEVTKFSTREEAEGELPYCYKSTLAEVIVDQINA